MRTIIAGSRSITNHWIGERIMRAEREMNKYQNSLPYPRKPAKLAWRNGQGLHVINQAEIDAYYVALEAYHQEAERLYRVFVKDGKYQESILATGETNDQVRLL